VLQLNKCAWRHQRWLNLQQQYIKLCSVMQCCHLTGTLSVLVCILQAREQLLVHSSTADRLRLELKARDDEKAALEVLLAKEKEAAPGRVRKAETDAAALSEERAKRQRLQDENKVRWHFCCTLVFHKG
jgi:hypothetical protein